MNCPFDPAINGHPWPNQRDPDDFEHTVISKHFPAFVGCSFPSKLVQQTSVDFGFCYFIRKTGIQCPTSAKIHAESAWLLTPRSMYANSGAQLQQTSDLYFFSFKLHLPSTQLKLKTLRSLTSTDLFSVFLFPRGTTNFFLKPYALSNEPPL